MVLLKAQKKSERCSHGPWRRLLGQTAVEASEDETISHAPPPKVINKALTGRIRPEWKGNGK